MGLHGVMVFGLEVGYRTVFVYALHLQSFIHLF
jgi:hypothetical protein